MIFLCSLDIIAGYEKQLQAYSSFSESIIFFKRQTNFLPQDFFMYDSRTDRLCMIIFFFFQFSEEMLSPWENNLIILYLNYFIQRTGYFILQRNAQKMQRLNIFMVAAWESRSRQTILFSLFILAAWQDCSGIQLIGKSSAAFCWNLYWI